MTGHEVKYPMKPEAVVVVLRHGERVLVILRGPQASSSGFWAPPSGRIEPGEAQPDTVIREMREELGITVRPLSKIWECETDDRRYLLHWWDADPGTAELNPHPGEVADTRWVTTDEFLELEPTFAGDREFFRNVLPALAP